MKPRPFTLLVTSAKVSFWMSLISVCVSLFPVVHYLTTLLPVTNAIPPHSLTDYVLLFVFALWVYSESTFIFILAILLLTAILTTVIAIILEVPAWIRFSLILSSLLFSIPFLWATILPLIGAPIMLLLSAYVLFYRTKSKSPFRS